MPEAFIRCQSFSLLHWLNTFCSGLGTRGGWATPSWTGPTTSTSGGTNSLACVSVLAQVSSSFSYHFFYKIIVSIVFSSQNCHFHKTNIVSSQIFFCFPQNYGQHCFLHNIIVSIVFFSQNYCQHCFFHKIFVCIVFFHKIFVSIVFFLNFVSIVFSSQNYCQYCFFIKIFCQHCFFLSKFCQHCFFFTK